MFMYQFVRILLTHEAILSSKKTVKHPEISSLEECIYVLLPIKCKTTSDKEK